MTTTEDSQKCLPNGLMFDAFGQPRTRFVRVTLEGSHCVLRPEDVAAFTAQECLFEDLPAYTLTDTYLSEREFNDLPDFDGF